MSTAYLNSEFAANMVALRTIVYREVRRFTRIWPQTLLPPFWQTVSLANPVLHMVNAFRYGILGVSDIRIGIAIGFMLVATALLYGVCIRLLVSGRGMRQ